MVTLKKLVIACVVTFFATQAMATGLVINETSLNFSLTPVGGYDSYIDGSGSIAIDGGDEFIPLLLGFGFNQFPADTGYKVQFGLIPVSQYTGTSADWNKTLGIEVSYQSGTDGKAYANVKGLYDTDKSVTITDILGGVDASVTITDILGGVDACILYTDYAISIGDVLNVRMGKDGTPSGYQTYNPTEWVGGAYVIAQVLDTGLTGVSISGSGVAGVVPEPATLLLLGLGGIALRKKRR